MELTQQITQQQIQCKERSLKAEIKRQVVLKNDEAEDNKKLTKMLLDSWKCIPDHDLVECLAWGYIEEFWTWKKCNSALLGIKTTVSEQTNAKGQKVLYHYTQNGKYFGTARTLGNEPIFYEGYFKITRTDFEFNRFKIKTAKNIEDLFEPEDKSENMTVASLA